MQTLSIVCGREVDFFTYLTLVLTDNRCDIGKRWSRIGFNFVLVVNGSYNLLPPPPPKNENGEHMFGIGTKVGIESCIKSYLYYKSQHNFGFFYLWFSINFIFSSQVNTLGICKSINHTQKNGINLTYKAV